MARKPISCPRCGQLYGGQGKVCRACFVQQVHESAEQRRICPLCGDTKRKESEFCRNCYEKQHARPEHYLERTCQKCSKTFTVHKAHVERGQGKYCSVTCARSGSPTRKKDMPIVVCRACGKTFEKYKANIRKNLHGMNFCSRECWSTYNQRQNHVGWSGGQHGRISPESRAWRKAVVARDKGHCRRCHSTEKLEAHHIQRYTTHPELRHDVQNGIALCRDCHVLFRNREEEYAEILSFMASVPVEVWHV